MPQGPLFQKVTYSWRFGPSVLRKFSLGYLPLTSNRSMGAVTPAWMSL